MIINNYTPLTNKFLKMLVPCELYTKINLAQIANCNPKYLEGLGVATFKNEDCILIFVTIKKSKMAITQYEDFISGTTLSWEGQTNRKVVEKRIVKGNYNIFTFIREEGRNPYTYYGRAIPIRQIINNAGTPSKIIFSLYEMESNPAFSNNALYVDRTDNHFFVSAEQETAIVTRTQQLQFRREALTLWNNACAISGVDNENILITSHIKPWRESAQNERINPKNSLVLSPTYDRLFNLGLITFNPSNGKIALSDKLKTGDWEALHVDDSKTLRKIPNGSELFLCYHNNYIYNFNPSELNIKELLII
jgi:hypothetical protein